MVGIRGIGEELDLAPLFGMLRTGCHDMVCHLEGFYMGSRSNPVAGAL